MITLEKVQLTEKGGSLLPEGTVFSAGSLVLQNLIKSGNARLFKNYREVVIAGPGGCYLREGDVIWLGNADKAPVAVKRASGGRPRLFEEYHELKARVGKENAD